MGINRIRDMGLPRMVLFSRPTFISAYKMHKVSKISFLGIGANASNLVNWIGPTPSPLQRDMARLLNLDAESVIWLILNSILIGNGSCVQRKPELYISTWGFNVFGLRAQIRFWQQQCWLERLSRWLDPLHQTTDPKEEKWTWKFTTPES